MKKLSGFTLIEILIALLIFAILATITSSTLYYAFNTRLRVSEQERRLSALQLAIALIQRDCFQALERGIRSTDMQLIPAFVGQKNYLELTQDGNLNLNSLEKRSTLKRIAYLCANHQLIRRSWASLDAQKRTAFDDKILLYGLSDCHFNYVNQTLQVLPEWRPEALTQNQNKELLPKAIQVNLKLTDWGEINLLFAIPGALYVS